jgi:hypothetical protein
MAAAGSHAWWESLLIALVGVPWLVAIALCWRRRPRDGAVPPSLGERLRRRLGSV